MTKRHISAVSLSAILGLCLTQFQNCAPAHSLSSADVTTDYTDARVGVDARNSSDLTFALSKVELRDDALTAAVGGLCARAHDGATLKMSVVDGASPLLTAEGSCSHGQFQIKLDNLGDMVCGVPHQLVVEGDWGASAAVSFVRRCQPVMSQAIDAGDSPYGTSCELEYRPAAHADGGGCQRVCYRLDQVINTTIVEAARCSPMATALAGP
jgi:hypothetical protein